MRVARDARHAAEREVEGRGGEARAREEGDEEGAKAAVDVQRERALECEPREGGDVVDDAVWEIGGGADEKDRVGVYESGDGSGGYLVRGCRAGDEVDLDLEVGACFAEGGVCRFREDPGGRQYV